MIDLLLDEPASPPIVEVHIWIGHYATGGEGILGAELPKPVGPGTTFMPLFNSSRTVAEGFEHLAKRIQSASQHARARITKIELRTFRAVTS
jgi:hypothetical protein